MIRSLLIALTLLIPSGIHAQVVTGVIDGDTISVEGIGSVRLIGVDTPETVDPREPVQLFGREASDFTRRMAEGKIVRLDYDWQRKDKYNRTLAYVYLPDGNFLNAEIVKQGYGHAYTTYPFKYLDEFRAYEREAREAERGLWGTHSHDAVLLASGDGQGKVDPDQIVYVTRTGTKYHRAGCRSLARSQIPIALKNVGSYGACGICRPPVLSDTTSKTPDVLHAAPRSEPKAQPASSGRCQATTKKGAQCSRRAQAGSSYCWQHQR
jgi:endonuclease YncB( thermonuclease family)